MTAADAILSTVAALAGSALRHLPTALSCIRDGLAIIALVILIRGRT